MQEFQARAQTWALSILEKPSGALEKCEILFIICEIGKLQHLVRRNCRKRHQPTAGNVLYASRGEVDYLNRGAGAFPGDENRTCRLDSVCEDGRPAASSSGVADTIHRNGQRCRQFPWDSRKCPWEEAQPREIFVHCATLGSLTKELFLSCLCGGAMLNFPQRDGLEGFSAPSGRLVTKTSFSLGSDQ